MSKILVTGGTGYIGSHTVIELLKAGEELVIVDNFSNSSPEVLENGIPNNIMPYIMKVAIGEYKELTIFGNDYPTPDGTGIRDYIHVVDLSKGHLKALEKIRKESGVKIYNLGTGRGYSVLELVKTFEKVNNVKIAYKIGKRRSGDIPACYADPSKAEKELNWKAEKSIEEMCRDSWNFIKNRFPK